MTTVIDHRIGVPGGSLFAREWGGGSSEPPLILIHDSLGCVELWRDFPVQLAAATQRRVIAYDRLGFGRSDPRTDPLTPQFVAEESRVYWPSLVRHFKLERFVPFGHSVGGGMAIHGAANFGAACAALIVESAQTFVEDRTLEGITAAKISFQDPTNVDRLRRYHGDKAQWVLDAWTETWLSPDFSGWTLDSALTRVRCRVLAIHGDQDEFGSLQHPERIRTLAGGPVQATILEGGGHVPHREQPATIVEIVAKFLGSSP